MSLENPKYKYLAAWNDMMNLGFNWRIRMQQEAEEENAPLDVVFKAIDDTWVRFNEIDSKQTRDKIQAMVDAMKSKEGK